MLGRRIAIWTRFGALAATLVIAALALTPATADAASYFWGQPVQVDHQPPFANSSAGQLTALSCPSSRLCVAAGSTNLASWPNPGQGPPAVKLVPGSDQRCDPEVPEYPCSDLPVTAISCPSATFCAEAYGGSYQGAEYGDVFIVMDPGGRASTLPGGGTGESGQTVLGVSCASSALCVAVDDGGDVLSSTDPTGASSTWTSAKVAGVGAFGAVSCPSTALCVAVSGADVVSSTNPAGGAAAWTVAQVDPGHRLTGVSCASASLCVAVDDAGNVVSSTNPAGGPAAWMVARVDPGHGLSRVSCPAASLCAAVDQAGNVVSSSDPSAGASVWTPAHIDSGALVGVSCPTVSLCVALDSVGNAVSSTDPTAGAGSWSADRLGGYNALADVACPGRALCVAVDDAGNVISSRDPTSAVVRWSIVRVDPGHALRDVSCATASLCLADDAQGRVFGSRRPAAGAGAWGRIRSPSLAGVSCASVRRGPLCLGFGSRSLFVSTQPLRGRWKRQIIPKRASSFVSCALPPQLVCFGLGAPGGPFFSSTDPAAGPRAWHSHRGPLSGGSDTPLGLWCPSARLCIAAAVNQSPDTVAACDTPSRPGSDCSVIVKASADPTSPRPAWRTVYSLHSGTSGFLGGGGGLSCPSASLCFLFNGSYSGSVHSLISTDPARAWRPIQIERGGGATSVACPSGQVCIAVDDRGNVIQGRRRA